jgi:D-3-phosphoglycerate dehydrogenase
MKVLIADKFESSGIKQLEAAGCDVTCDPSLKGPDLAATVRKSCCEVLVVRSTKVTRETLEAGGLLALVIRAGAGVDNIDVAAASERAILVANCPGLNSVAVAELAMALILALDRRVPDCVADLRAGRWNKVEYSKARGLKGRTLGLIGLGRIGRAVAQRAAAFEMEVIGWTRSMAHEGATFPGVTLCRTPREVAERADVVSVHLASSAQTRGFINRALFEHMRPGAYFINTSRGEVVDAEALAWAVREKQIRVGLDVYAAEPATTTADDFRDPLFALDGVVYGTPHIGASTDQAQQAIADETVRLVRLFRETGHVENCVNLCPRSPARRLLVVRHRNRPGVLAHVLAHVSGAGINVEEMENIILADAITACAQIRLDAAPGPDVLDAIRTGCEHILAVSLLEIPD